MNCRFPRYAIRLAAVPCILAVVAAPAFSDSPYFRFGLGTGGPANVDLPVPPPALPQAFPLSLSGFSPSIEPGGSATGAFSSGVPGVSYTSSGLPPGVTLSRDGVLSGQPSAPGKYTSTVTATDRIGRQSAVTLNFVVLPTAPTAAPSNDASSTLIAGMPFSATPVTTGAPITSWTMTSAPYEWLSVDQRTGRVYGVPPQGTTRFSYATAGTDDYGRTVPVSDTVSLSQPYLSAAFPSSAIPGDALSGSISSNLPGATFSASPLPTWLSLDPRTGRLSGTAPAVPGTYRFMASAVQGAAGAAFDIVLGVPEVTLTSTLPAMVSKGLTTTGILKASVGNGWAWSVLNAPPWLALDPSSGGITATPGTSDASVSGLAWQATRNGVTITSKAFGIELIDPQVTFNVEPPATMTEGDGVGLGATSNIPGAIFSLSGYPPTGSFITSNGNLNIHSGDIDADRDYYVTVVARSGDLTASRSFPIKVKAATVSLSAMTVRPNLNATQTMSTTMSGPGTWTVAASSGNVNAGTGSSSPSTTLSAGSPVTGTYTLTATYTASSDRAKASASATLTVLPPLLLGSQPTDQLFVVQSAKTVPGPGVSGASSGGTVAYALMKDGSPYAPSDLAGACPGLRFSTADGSISGTPTATCSVTGLAYRVSDDGGGVPGAAATVDSNGTFRVSVEPNELYGFTSQTFTTCGKSGRLGPAQGDCTAAYSNAAWTSNSLYFSVDANGKQVWTAPATGTYSFTVQGASGGGSPGRAALVSGSFALVTGDKITMVVGQVGSGYGGGGATAIFKGSTPLLVAGGSAGGMNGSNASLTTSGVSTAGPHQWGCYYGDASGGVNGYGGGGTCEGGGSGINGAGGGGGNGSNNPTGGAAIGPSGTAVGGLRRSTPANDGGYGGGGGAGFSGSQGGGGGGYSGGAGAGWTPNDYRAGGGGGSYASPTASAASIALAAAAGSGYVTVSRQ